MLKHNHIFFGLPTDPPHPSILLFFLKFAKPSILWSLTVSYKHIQGSVFNDSKCFDQNSNLRKVIVFGGLYLFKPTYTYTLAGYNHNLRKVIHSFFEIAFLSPIYGTTTTVRLSAPGWLSLAFGTLMGVFFLSDGPWLGFVLATGRSCRHIVLERAIMAPYPSLFEVSLPRR